MSLGDFIKSIFGFKSDRCQPNENIPDFYVFYEGDQEEQGQPYPHYGFDNLFHHFHGNMFQQMEELSRHMEDMFHNSGHVEFHIPPDFEGPHQKPPENPRDHMLKEPDGYTESQSQQPTTFLPPQGPRFFHPPPFFGRLPSPRIKDPDIEDLDEKGKADSIVDLLNNPSESSDLTVNSRSPSFGGSPFRSFTWSGSSTFSSQTIRGTEGKFEQKRTVRDSNGNEEITITRSIGNQTHSVTMKKDKTGATTEKIENFQNMDQDDLSKFEDKWRRNQQAIEDNPGDRMINPAPIKPDRGDNDSFFKKFFGF